MTIVPARRGWQWLVRGLLLFRMNPAMWTLLVFPYWMLIALINQIPLIGPLIATLFLPAFSVSFMDMCRELEQGSRILPTVLFSGFRTRLPTLVILGGLYLAAIMLVLGISTVADGGALANWVISGAAPDPAAVRSGGLSGAMIVAAVAGTPVVMAFWFAPVLAAWQGMGAAKALFFSFFAGWRNWRAFLVYGIMLAVLSLVLSTIVIAAATMLRGRPDVLTFTMVVAILVTMPTLFGSFYAAYRDIFPQSDDAVAP
jgi:hypothetical protein